MVTNWITGLKENSLHRHRDLMDFAIWLNADSITEEVWFSNFMFIVGLLYLEFCIRRLNQPVIKNIWKIMLHCCWCVLCSYVYDGCVCIEYVQSFWSLFPKEWKHTLEILQVQSQTTAIKQVWGVQKKSPQDVPL